MKLPPLKSILYFKYAAEYSSFKRAAEELNVTQAAISLQIRSLESHLNCQLFERHTRKVVLTSQGKLFYPHIAKAFEYLNTGLQSIELDPEPTTLILSVLPSFATCWLLPRINRFQQLHPEIKLRIDPNDNLIDFNASDADLGIRFGSGNYGKLQSICLASDEMLLAYKPGLIDPKASLKLQLKQNNLIMDVCPDAQRAWHILCEKIGLTSKYEPHILEIDNAALVVQATLAGQGIGMLRRQLIEPQLELRQLVALPNFTVVCNYQYFLTAPAGHFNWHKVKIFRQWLLSEFS
jgi:LysR family glycine cleavage system transcriptional activator